MVAARRGGAYEPVRIRNEDEGMPSDSVRGRLRRETEAGISWIIADNTASLSSYTRDMWEQLPAMMWQAEDDPDVRVIILAGAGEKAFSAGADISEFKNNRTGAEAKKYDEINHVAFSSVSKSSKPT